jgi:hypothetical protein
MTSILEAYVDESVLSIGPSKCLVYGAAIPHDLPAALDALTDVRARYGLPPDMEIKWSSKGGDPEIKAALKEEVITIVGRAFTCLFVIHADTDKDAAFLKLADLVHRYAEEEKASFIHLLYDHDAISRPAAISPSLSLWTSPQCTLFADVYSALSMPMQFADLAVGAFTYLVRSSLGLTSQKRTVFEWERGHVEPLLLEQVFGILLRHTIPGSMPDLDFDAPSVPIETFIKRCVGRGVLVDSRLPSQVIERVSEASTFYVGCMS